MAASTGRLIPWTARTCGTLLLLATLAATPAAQEGQKIPLGTRFTNELAAGQADALLFEAVAGTKFTMRIKGKQGLRPMLTLEDAQTGEQLAQAAGGKSAAIVKFDLPQTGLYRVRIEGTADGPIGPYVGRGKGKPPLEAKKQTLAPKKAAANALFTFPAVEGARLAGTLKRLDGGDGTSNWITLVGPEGEIDLTASIKASNDGTRLKIMLTELPGLGNYVLVADVAPTAIKAKLTQKPPLPIKGLQPLDPPAVQAVLAVDPVTGTAPLAVDFTDNSVGDVTTRSWEFGDDNGSTAAAPSHTFTEAGTYTVRLQVAGADGTLQTAEAQVEVLAGDPPVEPPPVADFEADVTLGEAPLEVAFTDLSVGTVDAWVWDFGDGNTAVEAEPTHTYTDPGTYSVRLTASNPGGPHSVTRTALIVVPDPADVVVAAFAGAPTIGNGPLPVAFTDLSTGPVLTRTWDFGDGNQSTLAYPVHLYTEPGTYTVTYTVEGPAGNSIETLADYVVVEDPFNFGPLDYAQDIHPIWTSQGASCVGCHGNSGGLTLSGTPEASYPEVLDRVNLGNPTASQILTKPAGIANHGGGKKWATGANDIRYQMILAWIEQGAQGP